MPRKSHYQNRFRLWPVYLFLVILAAIFDATEKNSNNYDIKNLEISSYPKDKIQYIRKLEKLGKEPAHQQNYVIFEKISLLYEELGNYKKALENARKSFELRTKYDFDWLE